MATILSLKRRIKAAQNVSKTTKAMQMISASKLKKAQSAALSTRPYVEHLRTLTTNVTSGMDIGSFDHPYAKNNAQVKKTLLIILGPDKGLCGGLTSNLIRLFMDFHQGDRDSLILPIGKKIEAQSVKFNKQVVAVFNFGTTTPTFDVVYPVLKLIDEYYLGGKVDVVKVLYTNFTSFFSQNATIKTLLPISIKGTQINEKKSNLTYVFEPGASQILPELLRHNVEMTLFHCFLESFAYEQASRMLNMQNATNNAKEIIEELRLEYNKTRQAKITSELLDITGAGAVSG